MLIVLVIVNKSFVLTLYYLDIWERMCLKFFLLFLVFKL